MIGTISIRLKNVTVMGYFPPPLLLEDPLVDGGTGVLTISFRHISYPPGQVPLAAAEAASTGNASPTVPIPIPFAPRGVRYHLEVTGGNRTNPLRVGQVVAVAALDEEGKPIPLATHLETIGIGAVATFDGPVGEFSFPVLSR